MRKFVINVSLFLMPVLLVAFLFEILLRNIPNDYLYKKEYLDNHSNEIETLILGNSHSFYGFNPVYFSSRAFNAAYISQSLNYNYEIFKKYQNRFHHLKTVILNISYGSLWGKLGNGNESESWRVKNYAIYYGINVTNSLLDYSEVFSNQPKINFKRAYQYYILTDSGQSITCSTLGWGTKYKSENATDLTESGKSAAKRHTRKDLHSKNRQNVFCENKEYLYSMIKWCQGRNIRVFLITPPAFETYRKHISLEQYQITTQTASDIASEFDNCVYMNMFEDTNFTAQDFFDADHLSEIGAEKVSKLIDKKISIQ